jgi:hypothetical protein
MSRVITPGMDSSLERALGVRSLLPRYIISMGRVQPNDLKAGIVVRRKLSWWVPALKTRPRRLEGEWRICRWYRWDG